MTVRVAVGVVVPIPMRPALSVMLESVIGAAVAHCAIFPGVPCPSSGSRLSPCVARGTVSDAAVMVTVFWSVMAERLFPWSRRAAMGKGASLLASATWATQNATSLLECRVSRVLWTVLSQRSMFGAQSTNRV
jgi:hypothetical protein